MEYTEEQKQEAEEVVMKYRRIIHLDIEYAINCAIHDRQSVLEELNSHFLMNFAYIIARKESLTQQIDYLKSKI